MPRKKARNTKGRIIAAAWKLFYEQGYEDTTIEDIVFESETSKGSFYHYFDGKDALLGTLSNVFDEKYEELLPALSPEQDAIEKLVFLNHELFAMIDGSISLDLLARLLSTQLLAMPGVRTWPDVVSVAFWCRRANLLKRKEEYGQYQSRLGRGVAFHIAPSNIPVNFVFSYFFALLAGNASVVRIPSKPFPQVEMICVALRRVLPNHPEIECRTAFVTYPISDEITASFCESADLRVIWSGDATIADIRRHPTKPKCLDIVFPDRYSICVLNGEAINGLDETMLKRLSGQFYNDTYLMDQNACSSPQLILWEDGSQGAVLERGSNEGGGKIRTPGNDSGRQVYPTV